jgi:hypothetical protein
MAKAEGRRTALFILKTLQNPRLQKAGGRRF